MAVCPADREPSGWPFAPPIGCPPRMGVCPLPIKRLYHPFHARIRSMPMQTQKGDPVGSPFNSGTDQKNQLKVIVDDPYLYRSSFSFAAS